MGKKIKETDAAIAKAAPFAQPILAHLRDLVHSACPEADEAIKWGFPNFIYHNNILCNMAAFKQHASFGFWYAAAMPDPDKILAVGERASMGHLGPLKSLSDLPADKILKKYIKEAMKLIDAGVKPSTRSKPAAPKELVIPEALLKALAKNKKAQKIFEDFSLSCKREYAEWINEAKTDATQQKRIDTAMEWIAEGKTRNWKYKK